MPHKPPTHKPTRLTHAEGRGSSAARGYGPRWRRLRAAVIAQRPLCEECRRVPSVDVDHIVARARGGTDAPANLRALCHGCHSRKTCQVDGGFGRGRG